MFFIRKFSLIFLFLSFSGFANVVGHSRWSVDFGSGFSLTELESLGISTDLNFGFGIYSQVNYRRNNIFYSLNSFGIISRVENIRLLVGNSRVFGKGQFRSLSFSPSMNIFLPYNYENWTPFIGFGPAISLQSIKFRQASIIGGIYRIYQKITNETFGLQLVLGAKRFTKNIDDVFTQILYRYSRGTKFSIIGGSHTTVKTLVEEKSPNPIEEHTFAFIVGIKVF